MVFKRVGASSLLPEYREKACPGTERRRDAFHHLCSLCSGIVGHLHLQPGLLWTTVMVLADHVSAHGSVPGPRRWIHRGSDWLRWGDARTWLWRNRGLLTRLWICLGRNF